MTTELGKTDSAEANPMPRYKNVATGLKPVRPPHTRVMIVLVALVIIFGALVIGWAHRDPQQADRNLADPAPTTEAKGQPTDRTETILTAIDNVSNQMGTRSADATREHNALNQGLTELGSRLSAIQGLIESQANANTDWRARVTALQSQSQDIAEALQQLKQKIAKPVEPSPTPAAIAPPFQLDGIDRWGDTFYAAISREGRVTFLREGEQQSGWQVTRIDAREGQVEFSGPVGQFYRASTGR